MNKTFALIGMAVVIFLAAPTAFAAEFIAGEGDNGNVTLSAGETHRNVYTAGGTVFVNSEISGDIYVAGGTVTIESRVEQDLVVVGGTVTINGEVGGDVRAVGGTVTINNRVSGDVLVAGGTVNLTEKSSVNGDLASGAGNLNIDAQVMGNAKIAGGTVTLNSTVNGKVEIQADQSFVLGSKAVTSQPISYKGVKEAEIRDGAQIAGVDFERIERSANNNAGRVFATIFTVAFVVKSIALILAGLLLLKLFPRTGRESVEYMQRGMWMNLLIGFLALVVGPVAVIILIFTFLGMYIGFAVILAWLLMLILSALVASVFAGAWIIKLLTKKNEMVYDWQSLVIGVIALAVLMLIPIIGSLVFLVLLLMAFGGMIRQLYDRMKLEQNRTQEISL